MPLEPVFAKESRWGTIGRILMIAASPLLLCMPCWMGCLVPGWGDDGEGPQDTIRQTISSPDGRLKDVVFTENPGWSNDDPSTEVSILRESDSLPTSDWQGNAFGCSHGNAPLASENDGPIVSVAWTGPKSVLVTYDDRSKVTHRSESVPIGHHLIIHDDVSLSYATNEPVPTKKSAYAGKWSGRCSWEGKIGRIGFSVAQFGDLFGLTLNDVLMNRGETILRMGDDGNEPASKTRLRLEGGHMRGILIANDGMAYSVDVHRSGPTPWVAPSS